MKDYPYMIRWTLHQLLCAAIRKAAFGYKRTLTLKEIGRFGGWTRK